MWAWLEKFLDHQIGYAYLAAAQALQNAKDSIVGAIAPLGNQGVQAVADAITKVLGKSGPVGAALTMFLVSTIESMGPTALQDLEQNAPAFVDALVVKLRAHGNAMVAA